MSDLPDFIPDSQVVSSPTMPDFIPDAQVTTPGYESSASSLITQGAVGTLEGMASTPGFIADIGQRMPFSPQGIQTLGEDARGIYNYLTGKPSQPRITPSFGQYTMATTDALVPDKWQNIKAKTGGEKAMRVIGDFVGSGVTLPGSSIVKTPVKAIATNAAKKTATNAAKKTGVYLANKGLTGVGDAMAGLAYSAMSQAGGGPIASLIAAMAAPGPQKWAVARDTAKKAYRKVPTKETMAEKRAVNTFKESGGENVAEDIQKGLDKLNDMDDMPATRKAAEDKAAYEAMGLYEDAPISKVDEVAEFEPVVTAGQYDRFKPLNRKAKDLTVGDNKSISAKEFDQYASEGIQIDVDGKRVNELPEYGNATYTTTNAVDAPAPTTPGSLRKYRTTDEVADNAGLAQLKQNLASDGRRAEVYKGLQDDRQLAREKVLSEVAPGEAVTKAAGGAKIRKTLAENYKQAKDKTSKAYEKINMDYEVNTGVEKNHINKEYAKLTKYGDPKIEADVLALQGEFLGGKRKKPIGFLEHIRRRAGELESAYRDTKNVSSAMAGKIKRAADDALDRAALSKRIPEDVRNQIKEARRLRVDQTINFESKKVGAVLKKQGRAGQYKMDDSKVFNSTWNGTPESADQLIKGIGGDKETMRVYRHLAIEDSIAKSKSAVTHKFTYGAFNKEFMQRHAADLEKWFTPEHLENVAEVAADLRSAERSKEIARLASPGSDTAQRLKIANVAKSSLKGKYALAHPVKTNFVKGLIEKFTGGIDVRAEQIAFEMAMQPEYALMMLNKRALTQKDTYSFLSDVARGLARKGAISASQMNSIKEQPEYIPEDQVIKPTPEEHREELMTAPEVEAKPKTISGIIAAQPPAIRAMIYVESNNKPNAKSKSGALGLMQVMPATGKGHGVTNLLDPNENIKAGTAEFKAVLKRFKSVPLAAAAYNWGQGNLSKLIRQKGTTNYAKLAPFMPKETRNHVAKYLNRLKVENAQS